MNLNVEFLFISVSFRSSFFIGSLDFMINQSIECIINYIYKIFIIVVFDR